MKNQNGLDNGYVKILVSVYWLMVAWTLYTVFFPTS